MASVEPAANSANRVVPAAPTGWQQSAYLRLIVTALTAVAIVAIAEVAAERMTGQPEEARLDRPANVHLVRRDLSVPLPVADKPALLLLGNSHTYALPGLQKGDILRDGAFASRPVLLDEINRELMARRPGEPLDCYAIAYPNFLPSEMLTRVALAYKAGLRPQLVVIGVTWRNVARDSQLRYAIRQAFRDPGFETYLKKMLAECGVEVGPELSGLIDAETRRLTAEQEKERVRSHADKLDEVLADFVGDHLALLGRSGQLRTDFQLRVIGRIQDWGRGIVAPLMSLRRHGADSGQIRYTYDVVESDLKINLQCLQALLKICRHEDATVVCYLAPERTDVPPLMDPAGEAPFISNLVRDAGQLGVTVIDARSAVPNEYWGWDADVPDRSHFTEPGHVALAKFLVDQMAERHIVAPSPAISSR